MKIEDLIKLTPQQRQKLSLSELRKAVKFTAQVAERRRTRLANYMQETQTAKPTAFHDWSPAAQKRIGIKNYWEAKFTPKSYNNINQLRHQLKINLNFLRAKTTTISGAKQELLKFYKRITKNKRAKWADVEQSLVSTEGGMSKFWKIYQRISTDPEGMAWKNVLGSERVQELIYEIMEENPFDDIDELYEKIDNALRDEYEGPQNANDSFDEEDQFTL